MISVLVFLQFFHGFNQSARVDVSLDEIFPGIFIRFMFKILGKRAADQELRAEHDHAYGAALFAEDTAQHAGWSLIRDNAAENMFFVNVTHLVRESSGNFLGCIQQIEHAAREEHVSGYGHGVGDVGVQDVKLNRDVGIRHALAEPGIERFQARHQLRIIHNGESFLHFLQGSGAQTFFDIGRHPIDHMADHLAHTPRDAKCGKEKEENKRSGDNDGLAEILATEDFVGLNAQVMVAGEGVVLQNVEIQSVEGPFGIINPIEVKASIVALANADG